jgi:hypothetical protein
MKRKEFISNMAKLSAFPFILPSYSFKLGQEKKVQHVVFCLIAGGLRNFESILKKEGNLMPNLLNGTESISSDIAQGIHLLPKVFDTPLSKQGTFFNNFKYNSSDTIHYSGHAAAITGNYNGNFQLMKPLQVPTIFEFFRKHENKNNSALKSWWVSDQNGPFPFLNYSNHKDYGPLYGANIIQPKSVFNIDFKNLNLFDAEMMSKVNEYKKLLIDMNLVNQPFPHKRGIINNEEDRGKIQNFLKKTGQKYFNNKDYNFWELGNLANNDIKTMFTACEIIKEFEPELMVVNMQDSDIGHSNFTKMCDNINTADFALAKLWETIQNTPNMKNNTVLIAAPEFGRNLNTNTLVDQYGRAAVDHTGDENSKKIFCLMLGPKEIIKSNNLVESENAETIDILPTIAHLLGFHDKIPAQFVNGKILKDALV